MLYIKNEKVAKNSLTSEQHVAFIKKCENNIGNLKNENKLFAAQPIVREGVVLKKNYMVGLKRILLPKAKIGKGKLIIFWVATGLLVFGMLGSELAQIFHAKDMVDLVVPLGYPLYFLYIIGTWKILGVITILIPQVKLLKEWAYSGFLFCNDRCINFTFSLR
jgi:hypothetical protein